MLRASPSLRDSRAPETDAAGQLSISYDNTDRAGEYDVSVGGNPPIKFAAQADKNESNLAEITKAQKTRLAQSAQVISFKAGQNVRDLLANQQAGAEFWLPFAAIALFLGVAETFLADWFSRAK